MANKGQKAMVINKEIEMQRVQALMSYFQTRINIAYSIFYGFIIGYLIFLATLYFQGTIYSQFISLHVNDDSARVLNLGVFSGLLLALYVIMKPRIIQLNSQRDKCLRIVDELFQKVDKGIPIPSLIELKECEFPEKTIANP
jgi:hypothetical protein